MRNGALLWDQADKRLYVLNGAIAGDAFLWHVEEYRCELGASRQATVSPLERPFEHEGRASDADDDIQVSTISTVSMSMENGELTVHIEAKSAQSGQRVDRSVLVDLNSCSESWAKFARIRDRSSSKRRCSACMRSVMSRCVLN